MNFFFIFLGLLFIVYLISYNNRDKSKDYLYQRHPTTSPGEASLMYDIGEAIDVITNKSINNGTDVKTELLSLKEHLINDMPFLCKKYTVDRFTAKMVIDVCFENTFKKL